MTSMLTSLFVYLQLSKTFPWVKYHDTNDHTFGLDPSGSNEFASLTSHSSSFLFIFLFSPTLLLIRPLLKITSPRFSSFQFSYHTTKSKSRSFLISALRHRALWSFSSLSTASHTATSCTRKMAYILDISFNKLQKSALVLNHVCGHRRVKSPYLSSFLHCLILNPCSSTPTRLSRAKPSVNSTILLLLLVPVLVTPT